MPASGYAWWYLEAISDEGSEALTMAAFIGSVFSPYCARAIRRGCGDPENFASLTLALHRPSGALRTMTERRRRHVVRDAATLAIGPSCLDWGGGTLEARIDEIASPVPRRVRGRLRVTARRVEASDYPLDTGARHLWRPIAPCARIEVAFDKPALRWSGHAYLDHHRGAMPLARDFRSWSWSRAATDDGAVIFYDAIRRDGTQPNLALRFSRHVAPEPIAAPPFTIIRSSHWRLRRRVRADADTTPRLVRTLEDAPFHARSRLVSSVHGVSVDTVQDTLDLDRLENPIVRQMSKLRIPRAPW